MPERLAGEANCEKLGKEVTRQPWKWEPLLPAAANWHHHTEKILSGRDTYQVKYLPVRPHMTAGREEREQESTKIRNHKAKGDPQRSARIACKIMQNDSSPKNPKWATPHVTHVITEHRWLHWLEVNLA